MRQRKINKVISVMLLIMFTISSVITCPSVVQAASVSEESENSVTSQAIQNSSILLTSPSAIQTTPGGITYYVDSATGNDGNNGISQETPWKTITKVSSIEAFLPGDKILLKAGSIWNGQMLNIKGSGQDGLPIVVDTYGNGNKPIINGCGIEYPNATVRLGNQSYVEIRNLEITNNDYDEENRAGVLVRSNNKEVNKQIKLINLNIHDVKGDNSWGSGKSTGGIVVDCLESEGTRYDGILVEGCVLNTVDRTGICVGWISESLTGATGSDKYNTNVVIRNNVLNDIGGDGIMVLHTAAPLVEYNVSQSSNMRSSKESMQAGFACGMWPWSCDDAVFQYNEVYGVRWNQAEFDATGLGEDGTAFDVDGFNFRSIHQYNYSHDNQGGFMMVCGNKECYSENSIIRYNISQNDQDDIFDMAGPNKKTYIYNNVFYTKAGLDVKPFNVRSNGGAADETYCYNNIFYNLGTGSFVWEKSTNNVFDSNVFFGNHLEGEPKDPHKITTDPMLVNPGSGVTGLKSLEGYKLKKGSPCIDTGKLIGEYAGIDNGGKDFWGNVLYTNAPDIGVHESIYSAAVGIGMPTGITSTPEDNTIKIEWASVQNATSYDINIDDIVKKDVSSPYIYTGLTTGSTHKFKIRAKNADIIGEWSSLCTVSTTSTSTNQIVNSGFEEDLSKGWPPEDWGVGIVPVKSEDANSGKYSMSFPVSAACNQEITTNIYSGKTYTFSCWSKKTDEKDSNGYIGINFFDIKGKKLEGSNIPTVEVSPSSSVYEQLGVTFTMPADVSKIQIYVTGCKFFIDDIMLQRSPIIPIGLAATVVSSSNMDIAWTKVLGATGYDLLVDGKIIENVDSPYSQKGITAGSVHTYRVRAKYSGGVSAWSSVVRASQIESSNILVNSGFEAGTMGWDVGWGAETITGDVHSGTYAIKGSDWQGRSQIVTKGVTAGKTYIVSLWGKALPSAVSTEKKIPAVGTIDVVFYNKDGAIKKADGKANYAEAIRVQDKSEYTLYTGQFTTPADTVKLEFSFQANDGTFIADDITLDEVIPINLKAESVDESNIKVGWTNLSCEVKYDLMVDEEIVSNVSSPYQHTSLISGSKHNYKIRSVIEDKASEWSQVIIGIAQKPLKNLLTNGDFETGDATDWDDGTDTNYYGDISVVNDNAYTGQYAMRACQSASDGGGFLRFISSDVQEDVSYSLVFYGKADLGTTGYVGVNCYDAEGKSIKDSAVELAVSGTNYQEYGGKFTVPVGTKKLGVYLAAAGSANKYVYVDDFSLCISQPSFNIISAQLNRNGGISATANVKRTAGAVDNAGKETIIFQLMDGNTPVSIIALEDDIDVTKDYTAHFKISDPQKISYKVKIFVFDKFSTSDSAAENLAVPKIME